MCPSCRHALPLFTSLLNIVCAYDPVGYGIPYNHLLFSDYREPLVEEAAQVLIVTLDYDSSTSSSPTVDGTTTSTAMDDADVSHPVTRGPCSRSFSYYTSRCCCLSTEGFYRHVCIQAQRYSSLTVLVYKRVMVMMNSTSSHQAMQNGVISLCRAWARVYSRSRLLMLTCSKHCPEGEILNGY